VSALLYNVKLSHKAKRIFLDPFFVESSNQHLLFGKHLDLAGPGLD